MCRSFEQRGRLPFRRGSFLFRIMVSYEETVSRDDSGHGGKVRPQSYSLINYNNHNYRLEKVQEKIKQPLAPSRQLLIVFALRSSVFTACG